MTPSEWELEELDNPLGHTPWVYNSCNSELSIIQNIKIRHLNEAPWSSDGDTTHRRVRGLFRSGTDKKCLSFKQEEIKSVLFSFGVTSIPQGMFKDCKHLPKITFSKSITDIESCAFKNCDEVYTFVIPNSVVSIGCRAFDGCCRLTSIVIPDSVTNIGDYAFSGCSGLVSITIPKGVELITSTAFLECELLTGVHVSKENQKFSSADGVLFDKEKTHLICCPCGKDGSYDIPNTVISIGASAFRSCTLLTSVTIPSSVIQIGELAFGECHRLSSIVIPGSVESIGYCAFKGCNRLKSVLIAKDLNYSTAGFSVNAKILAT